MLATPGGLLDVCKLSEPDAKVSLKFCGFIAVGACSPASAAGNASRAGCIGGAGIPRSDGAEVALKDAGIASRGIARAEGIGPRMELVATVTSPGWILMLVWW